jgi:hypothetical protein
VAQRGRLEAALREHQGGPGLGQLGGVHGLVVVRGGGQRDQHGGLAEHAELGQRGGARAADHEVRRGVRGGHVVDEGLHAGRHAERGVALAHLLEVRGAGLVHHVRPRAHGGDGVGHELVDRPRPLRAAEHEEAPPRARSGAGVRRQGRAHGVTELERLSRGEELPRGRERDEHALDDPREQLVGDPRDRVLLHDRRGDPAQAGRQHDRPRRVPAHPDHHRGPQPPDQLERLEERPRKLGEPGDLGAQAHALEPLDVDELERKPCLGHGAHLEAARGAHEAHGMAAPPQLLGHGDARVKVAPGPPTGNEGVHERPRALEGRKRACLTAPRRAAGNGLCGLRIMALHLEAGRKPVSDRAATMVSPSGNAPYVQ